jgi:hypothetical protein
MKRWIHERMAQYWDFEFNLSKPLVRIGDCGGEVTNRAPQGGKKESPDKYHVIAV